MVAAPNPLALAAVYAATAALLVLAVPILVGLCALVAIEWTLDVAGDAFRASGAVYGDVLDPAVRA